MITLARLDQSARPLGDPSAALPVATALLGPEYPSKDAVYVDFASVILFGDQVLDQFGPLELARRSEPNGNSAALVKATLTIAAINQWLRASQNTA
jgi:hypothetical protein